MAVSYLCIYYFFNSQKLFFFSFRCTTHNKTKILGNKNTVRVPSRMRLTKTSVFLHYFSKFWGILLFLLKYIYISMLLKITNEFSWQAKSWPVPLSNLEFNKTLRNILKVIYTSIHTKYVCYNDIYRFYFSFRIGILSKILATKITCPFVQVLISWFPTLKRLWLRIR